MSYLLLYGPRTDTASSYRSARHESLNFEACGGEHASSLDSLEAPSATLYRFPENVSGTVITRTRGKDITMAKNENPRSRDDRESSRSTNQRVETFRATGAVRANVVGRSGDITVRVGEGTMVQVTLRAADAQHDHLLDRAVVKFDEKRGELEVRARTNENGDGPRDLKSLIGRSSWFQFGSSDLDVEIVLPAHSSVEIATISGDTQVRGELDRVKVSGVSGDVEIDDHVREVEVNTASGDILTGDVTDTLKCRTASGDVRSKGAGAATDVVSASGDVRLSATQAGELTVKAVSGDVRVEVARGLAVDVNGDTVSGELGSNIELDAAGDGASDDEVIYIKITTISGDVWISRAS